MHYSTLCSCMCIGLWTMDCAPGMPVVLPMVSHYCIYIMFNLHGQYATAYTKELIGTRIISLFPGAQNGTQYNDSPSSLDSAPSASLRCPSNSSENIQIQGTRLIDPPCMEQSQPGLSGMLTSIMTKDTCPVAPPSNPSGPIIPPDNSHRDEEG